MRGLQVASELFARGLAVSGAVNDYSRAQSERREECACVNLFMRMMS